MDGMLCDRCGLPATHFHEDYGNVCASCAAHWSERFDTRHEHAALCDVIGYKPGERPDDECAQV